MVGQLVPLLRGQARGPGPKEAQGPADPPPQQQPAPATSSALSEPQQVVLRHRPAPNSSAETPVTFVIWRPRPPARAPQAAPAVAPAGEKQLPVIFFLNGALVEADSYSSLAKLLARRGYTSVLSDYYRDLPSIILNVTLQRPPGCPTEERGVITSVALLRTFEQWAEAAPGESRLSDLRARGVVIISHSQGGLAAIQALIGACGGAAAPAAAGGFSLLEPGYNCEGFDPGTHPNACSAAATRNASSSGSSNSSTSSSGKARAAAGARPGLLRGVIAWEGYTPNNITLPAGTFLALMGSPQNTNTRRQFDGAPPPPGGGCACATYAQFPGVSHFGVTNAGVRTRCATFGRSDPKGYKVASAAAQGRTLEDIARLADDQIRAFALGDKAALARLSSEAAASAKLAPPAGRQQGTAPLLLLNPACYKT